MKYYVIRFIDDINAVYFWESSQCLMLMNINHVKAFNTFREAQNELDSLPFSHDFSVVSREEAEILLVMSS